MIRRFAQVDVFADRRYLGNPLAVVLDADGLSDADMAAIAAWTNLSETTFVLEPTVTGADYRVRIFTPSVEFPFAGHPTLGTCHAWLGAGGRPAADDVVVQECGIGLVPVRRAGDRLAFAAPPLLRTGPADDAVVDTVTAVTGLSLEDLVAVEWIDNGPGWVGALVADDAIVHAIEPDLTAADSFAIGVVGLTSPSSRHVSDPDAPAIEVRAFHRSGGRAAAEDPVTGSLNASLAQWLIGSGRLRPPYVAAQGAALGRSGRVHVHEDDGALWIGGRTITCIDGTIEA